MPINIPDALTVLMDGQIERLTSPELGLVRRTEFDDIFALGRSDSPKLSLESGALVVTGPSGTGKDTIIEALIELAEQSDPPIKFTKVRTATSRDRRVNIGEPVDAYTWIRRQRPGEDNASYIDNVVAEYGLIEHDYHHGNIYGMPRQNFAEAALWGTPLMNTDTRGIRTLKRALPTHRIVSVLVCPESTGSLAEMMGGHRENASERLATAAEYLAEAPNVVDYVLLNRVAEDVPLAASNAAHNILKLVHKE